MRGEDRHARVSIPLEDAYHGTTRTLTLERSVAGADGGGTRTLNVKIPAGVTEGQQIRLAGQGGTGLGDAPAGDLYLEVSFAPHRMFRADGRDVVLELPVAPWEAALGETVTVPTLGGKVDLRIPAGVTLVAPSELVERFAAGLGAKDAMLRSMAAARLVELAPARGAIDGALGALAGDEGVALAVLRSLTAAGARGGAAQERLEAFRDRAPSGLREECERALAAFKKIGEKYGILGLQKKEILAKYGAGVA